MGEQQERARESAFLLLEVTDWVSKQPNPHYGDGANEQTPNEKKCPCVDIFAHLGLLVDKRVR